MSDRRDGEGRESEKKHNREEKSQCRSVNTNERSRTIFIKSIPIIKINSFFFHCSLL